jgi:sRNA-binding carbon storage regulator CsrA
VATPRTTIRTTILHERDSSMSLVLSRKMNESVLVHFGDRVCRVTANSIKGRRVSLDFDADADIRIVRAEVAERDKLGGNCGVKGT